MSSVHRPEKWISQTCKHSRRPLAGLTQAKFILEDRDAKPSALALRTPKGGNDSSFYVFIRIDLFVFGWLRARYM